ncbi:maltotransferase domain-containing protein, partial [Streptomyces longisporoflavus]|uniref:maltotransferase domain-containing protein n=1 Tax=Streptomyces longisporoflavus TaxID=28044 RepID=UPI00167E1169
MPSSRPSASPSGKASTRVPGSAAPQRDPQHPPPSQHRHNTHDPQDTHDPRDANDPQDANGSQDSNGSQDAQAPPPRPTRPAPLTGRIPVLDVAPLVYGGRRPAKAVVGETFQVTATVFREGHEAVAANVVLRDPRGRPGPWTPMRELAPGTDRWGADVTPDAEGLWTYSVEAWGDPVTQWRHHAHIKIPAGIDTDLVLEEGARLHDRAAADAPAGEDRATLRAAAEALRDTDRPVAARLAAALTPEVDGVLAGRPLRELVTESQRLPLLVERRRALFGSWYEFFPRSEGA